MILMKALFFLDFHEDDVIPDLANAIPGDDIFTFPSEKVTETAGSGDNQSCKPGGFYIEFHIDRTAKAAAGTGIDDFFLFKFTYTHRQTCFF